MKISVTKKDIARGEPGSDVSCPIALALQRKGVARVSVADIICGSLRGKWFNAEIPYAARKFMRRFDGMGPVKPFSFTLNIK